LILSPIINEVIISMIEFTIDAAGTRPSHRLRGSTRIGYNSVRDFRGAWKTSYFPTRTLKSSVLTLIETEARFPCSVLISVHRMHESVNALEVFPARGAAVNQNAANALSYRGLFGQVGIERRPL
jgi:hypothetical protein